MGDAGFRLSSRGVMLAAISAAFPLPALAAPAARVEFAVGNAQLERPGRVASPLVKGVEVDSGDTVLTNDGRVQLRFSDGAYVSLQPGSQFRIDDYRFEGRTDGSERGIFSLLKGGLRTITGLVGRTNKKAYQVNTSVATIGIRGTEYTIAYTNSLSGSVGEGEVEACNAGGCSSFTSGESFFIAGTDIKPALTDKKADLPPQQPGDVAGVRFPGDVAGGIFQTANDPSKPNGAGSQLTLAAANKTTESGLLAGLLLTGPQSNWVYNQDGFSNLVGSISGGGNLVLDERGAATSVGVLQLQTSRFGNTGIISWGRAFSPTSSEFVNFAAGIPVPAADLSNLSINRVVATYDLVRQVSGQGLPGPVANWMGGPTTGQFTSGTIKADFNAAMMALDLGMSFDFNKQGETNAANILSLSMTGTGKINSGQFGHAPFGGPFQFSTGGSCSVPGGGTCTFLGLFAGNNAAGAAVVVDANTSAVIGGTPESLSIRGAAGFERQP